jgi:hypothetical protein
MIKAYSSIGAYGCHDWRHSGIRNLISLRAMLKLDLSKNPSIRTRKPGSKRDRFVSQTLQPSRFSFSQVASIDSTFSPPPFLHAIPMQLRKQTNDMLQLIWSDRAFPIYTLPPPESNCAQWFLWRLIARSMSKAVTAAAARVRRVVSNCGSYSTNISWSSIHGRAAKGRWLFALELWSGHSRFHITSLRFSWHPFKRDWRGKSIFPPVLPF